MAITQLIINGVAYPKTSRDKYKCYRVPAGEQIRMANLEMVYELRGSYTCISYAYDYFEPELMRQCLKDLRGKEELEVSYLPDDGTEMQSGFFRCTKLPQPTFAFGRGGRAYWHNIDFELEAVEPDAADE